MNTGVVLRTLRAASGLSQEAFSRRLGVSQSYLSLLEGCRRPPSVRVRARVAVGLGIPLGLLEQLLGAVPTTDETAGALGRLVLDMWRSKP